MKGKRIAIFGLGRSGLAIAKACLKLGAFPVVYDQKQLDDLPKRDAYDDAIASGATVILGWDGMFDPQEVDLVVSNPAVSRRHPALLDAVGNGLEVISEVEFAFRISKAPIVAITGTNGKSTTTVMTYLCLEACGEKPVLCGNIFGSGYPEVPLTEAALNASPDQTLVAEISSFQLEWVSKFKPVSAGITNIWPDHLDRYTGFDEYAATKQRLFAQMDDEDTAVVKANDPVVIPPGGKGLAYRPRRTRTLAAAGQGKTFPLVLTFGATGEHSRVEEMEMSILNQRVKLRDLPFDEPHNYLNASMAALLTFGLLRWRAAHDPASSAAILMHDATDAELARLKSGRTVYDAKIPDGTPLALPRAVVDGLLRFGGLAHRMERLGEKDGVRVINNSMCTNPDAVIKSAQSVRDPVHLLIGGVNKGLDFGPLRHYLANHRHCAYLFGSNAAELNEMLGGGWQIFVTMQEAFEAATLAAKSGEVIMLAPGCASTDQFRDFRDRGNVFKAMAKEWLNL